MAAGSHSLWGRGHRRAWLRSVGGTRVSELGSHSQSQWESGLSGEIVKVFLFLLQFVSRSDWSMVSETQLYFR